MYFVSLLEMISFMRGSVSIAGVMVNDFQVPFPELFDPVLGPKRPGSFRPLQFGNDGVCQGAVIAIGDQTAVITSLKNFPDSVCIGPDDPARVRVVVPIRLTGTGNIYVISCRSRELGKQPNIILPISEISGSKPKRSSSMIILSSTVFLNTL